MTISGISSSSSSVAQLFTTRTRTASEETGQTTAQEKPSFADMFAALDADGNNSLDATEVQSLTDKISEASGVSVDLSEFLTTYDADGNGTLNEDETATALEANRPQGPPPGGMMGGPPDEADMVSTADEDGDGVISVEEAEGLVDMINNATGSSLTAEEFVSDYDEDGDGSFSTDEAVAALEANRPGSSSSSESTAATSESTDSLTAAAIENYIKMASLGMETQGNGDPFSMGSNNSGSLNNIA